MAIRTPLSLVDSMTAYRKGKDWEINQRVYLRIRYVNAGPEQVTYETVTNPVASRNKRNIPLSLHSRIMARNNDL